jgi:hypothetical protein
MPLKDLNTSGFCGAQMKGSEHDLHIRMELQNESFRRYSGGISNGMDFFSVLLLNR